MPEADRAAESSEILAWLEPRLEPGQTVLTFASTPTEPNLDSLRDLDSRLIFPLVVGDGKLELREVEDPDKQLKPGAFGIREPDRDRCPRVSLSEIDLILTPGLAFSRDGLRLGQGGGFYDRLLADAHAEKIGICFRQQLLEAVPVELHDARVDRVALWVQGIL